MTFPDTATPLAAGMHVTPSIKLVRKLGQGSMGEVWIADHLGLHTQVVVKFMSAEHLDVPVTRARFEREGALAAQAKSPNVVQVFDHGLSMQGLPYIAMELLEGEDLGKRLKRDLAINPITFSNWLAQACKGLSRAHKNGVVHRDIKPANIFLCENDGEVLVKILDFGIAKGDTGSDFHGTATNVALGTPFYMAPEQITGSKNVDHRADLWSLGVVTYKAITGSLPFTGDVMGALVMAISMHPHTPPSQRLPSLTPAIDDWMLKALAKDPSGRFASAKDMALSFAEAVSSGLSEANDSAIRSSLAKLRASVEATTWPSSPNLGPETPMTAFDTAAATTRNNDRSSLAPNPPEPAPRRGRSLALGTVLGMALTGSAIAFAVMRPQTPPTHSPAIERPAIVAPHATDVPSASPPSSAAPSSGAASASANATSSASPSASASGAASASASSIRPKPLRPKPPRPPKVPNPLEMPLQ